MSKSSATFRIISISNGKTYYTIMQCDQGDINQFYDDSGAVFPTFGGTNCPTVMFLVYDSENSAKSIVVPDANIKWFVKRNRSFQAHHQNHQRCKHPVPSDYQESDGH